MAKKKTKPRDPAKARSLNELIAHSERVVQNTRKTVAKMKALAAEIEANQKRRQ